MAWVGAAATNAILPSVGGRIARITFVSANGLAARIAGPAIAAADTGGFTTDVAVVANYTSLPAAFGKGSGGYIAADAGLFSVIVHDRNAVLQGGIGQTSKVYHVSTVLNVNQIQFIFHNDGIQVAGDLEITIHYLGV